MDTEKITQAAAEKIAALVNQFMYDAQLSDGTIAQIQAIVKDAVEKSQN